MKSTPIIFSAVMIRAILENRKTQTRRLMKPQPERPPNGYPGASRDRSEYFDKLFETCPYGQVGDELWVREGFRHVPGFPGIGYRADVAEQVVWTEGVPVTQCNWVSPIFMPRSLSRITLKIIELAFERVQDILKEDAIAEGLEVRQKASDFPLDIYSYGGNLGEYFDPICEFGALWNTINTANENRFTANPLVWVVKFQVQPIDSLEDSGMI